MAQANGHQEGHDHPGRACPPHPLHDFDPLLPELLRPASRRCALLFGASAVASPALINSSY
jgi:hypothetical protein